MVKYYYEEDDFKLLDGDSLLLLKKIIKESIDMIFTDPPYFLSNISILIYKYLLSNYLSRVQAKNIQ